MDDVALRVQQLVYRGAAVADVFLIDARYEAESRHIVLYTPDAPDGLAFREFVDRETMMYSFLLDRRFESYLLGRLPARFATLDDHSLPRFDVLPTTRTVRWTFGGDGCGFCTMLEEPFTYREVIGHIADTAYDTAIALTEDDTAYFSRSTAQADADETHRKLRLVHSQATLMGSIVGDLGLATLHAVPQMAQASWRFYDAARAGHASDAFLHAVDGYVAALNVLPFYMSTPRALMAAQRMRHGPMSNPRRAYGP